MTAIQPPARAARCRPSAVLRAMSWWSSSAGLGEVVVGELDVADLRGDDGLGAGGQRGVAHGQRLVVGEVAALLLRGERIGAQGHRQHEVGLLDDLAAVELEVGDVQQQRIVLGRRGVEVERRVAGEVLVLQVDAELGVVGDRHGVGRPSPRRHLARLDAERLAVRGARRRRPRRAGWPGP